MARGESRSIQEKLQAGADLPTSTHPSPFSQGKEACDQGVQRFSSPEAATVQACLQDGHSISMVEKVN